MAKLREMPSSVLDRVRDIEWEDIVRRYRAAIAEGKDRAFDPREIADAATHMLYVRCMKRSEIAKQFGKYTGWMSDHIRLQFLEPSVWALLDPALPEYERLSFFDGIVVLSQAKDSDQGQLSRAQNLISARKKASAKAADARGRA